MCLLISLWFSKFFFFKVISDWQKFVRTDKILKGIRPNDWHKKINFKNSEIVILYFGYLLFSSCKFFESPSVTSTWWCDDYLIWELHVSQTTYTLEYFRKSCKICLIFLNTCVSVLNIVPTVLCKFKQIFIYKFQFTSQCKLVYICNILFYSP